MTVAPRRLDCLRSGALFAAMTALLGVDRTRVRQVEERALGKVYVALKLRGVM